MYGVAVKRKSDGAPPGGYRLRVDPARLFHADGGVVKPADSSVRAHFQQLFYVRPAAAAAVKHGGILAGAHELKPPVRQRAVADVHHQDHCFPAKPCRLARVFKK